MPLINIEYDNEKVNEVEAFTLSEAIREIVSRITEIEDVFVYANSADVKVQIAPIEIFIRMTAKKIKNEDNLINEVKIELKKWKEDVNFKHLINLTLIPMNWKIEIGI